MYLSLQIFGKDLKCWTFVEESYETFQILEFLIHIFIN